MSKNKFPSWFLELPQEEQDLMNKMYETGQHVYFILAKELNLVKIGIAQEPHRRLYGMQIGSPTDLELIFVIPYAGYIIERKLHTLFKDLRKRGEWFRYEQPIKDIIKEAEPLTKEVDLQWSLTEHKIYETNATSSKS